MPRCQDVSPPLKAKGCARIPAVRTLSTRREQVLFARSVPGIQTTGGDIERHGQRQRE
jgi:hypothetical protein